MIEPRKNFRTGCSKKAIYMAVTAFGALITSLALCRPAIADWGDLDGPYPDSATRVEDIKILESLSTSTRELVVEFPPENEESLAEILNRFANLESLFLSGKNISDRLIKKLRLRKLNKLVLNDTSVHGTGFIQPSRFPKLKSIELTDSTVSRKGLKCLKSFNLVNLSLSECKIDSSSLDTLAKFDKLRILDISMWNCNSRVLESVPRQVQELNLGGCSFPNGLASLSKLKSLKRLYLVGAELKPEQADAINQVRTLECLFLPEVGPLDPWLERLQSLSKIEKFPIRHYQFTDKTGELLSAFHQLQEISLFPLQSPPQSFFEHLDSFQNLQKLDLTKQKITDSTKINWQGFSKLRDLRLTDTMIGDATVTRIKALPLVHLSLVHTNITGASMKPLSELPSLRFLDLSDNVRLSKNLSSMGRFDQLQQLVLWRCHLVDDDLQRLPEFGNLAALTLAGNAITDNAISSICKIHPSKYLDVSFTSISPAGIQRLERSLPNCKVTTTVLMHR